MTALPLQLREGEEIPALTVRPDLGQVIRFCAASWVFPPIFYDVEAARAQGMPGTLIPGPLKLGFLYRAVEEWLGDAGFVRQVRAAHRRPDVTGSALTVRGRVVRAYEESGRQRADLELAVENEAGETSVRGYASVELY
ncbi:MAG: hypothetical protein IT304_00875 [Dehalococcoidia bacterium]|nr:hypothetical protein [Dehalococcoidia bacterium]